MEVRLVFIIRTLCFFKFEALKKYLGKYSIFQIGQF